MTIKYLFFLISMFIFVSSNAYELEKSIFDQRYFTNYESLMCSHNVMALIEQFHKNDISLDNTYVIHVRTLNPQYSPVNAYQTRTGTQSWSFHAFLVHNSYVYDMDYTSSPQIKPLKSYLESMFFPQYLLKNQTLLYQIKPAGEYSIEDFDGTMDTVKYPLRSLTPDTNAEVNK